MIVFSAGGLTAVPVEMARGARARGLRVIAVTSVAAVDVGRARSRPRRAGCSTRPTSSSTCARRTRTRWSTIDGLDTPVGPGIDDRRGRHRQWHQGADRRAARRSAGRCRRSSPGPRSSAPSARGRCSMKPIESMRGDSPVPSPGRGDGRGRHAQEVATNRRTIGSPSGASRFDDATRSARRAQEEENANDQDSTARRRSRLIAVVAVACSSGGGTAAPARRRRRPSRPHPRRRRPSRPRPHPAPAAARRRSATRTAAASATASARSRSAPPRPRRSPRARSSRCTSIHRNTDAAGPAPGHP